MNGRGLTIEDPNLVRSSTENRFLHVAEQAWDQARP